MWLVWLCNLKIKLLLIRFGSWISVFRVLCCGVRWCWIIVVCWCNIVSCCWFCLFRVLVVLYWVSCLLIFLILLCMWLVMWVSKVISSLVVVVGVLLFLIIFWVFCIFIRWWFWCCVVIIRVGVNYKCNDIILFGLVFGFVLMLCRKINVFFFIGSMCGWVCSVIRLLVIEDGNVRVFNSCLVLDLLDCKWIYW